MKFKILGQNLLVEPITEENEDETFVLPTDENYIRGKVVAMGDGRVTTKLEYYMYEVDAGDIVHFDRRDAKDWPIDDETFYLIPLDRILGIETGEDK